MLPSVGGFAISSDGCFYKAELMKNVSLSSRSLVWEKPGMAVMLQKQWVVARKLISLERD